MTNLIITSDEPVQTYQADVKLNEFAAAIQELIDDGKVELRADDNGEMGIYPVD